MSRLSCVHLFYSATRYLSSCPLSTLPSLYCNGERRKETDIKGAGYANHTNPKILPRQELSSPVFSTNSGWFLSQDCVTGIMTSGFS